MKKNIIFILSLIVICVSAIGQPVFLTIELVGGPSGVDLSPADQGGTDIIYSTTTLSYTPGTLVNLSAFGLSTTPDPLNCFSLIQFNHWEGDIETDPTAPDCQVLADGDKTITAFFDRYDSPCHTPTPPPTPTPFAPQVYFVPQVVNKELLNLEFYTTGIPTEPTLFPPVIIGDFEIQNDLHVNTGTRKLAAYGIDITFDNSVVIINTEKGNSGVERGSDGFVAAVNAGIPGKITISGFDTDGQGPGDLHLLILHWLAQTYEGSTDLVINIDRLVDETTAAIGIPNGVTGQINITTRTCTIGDINNDGNIDIVDALLAAQYYVGIVPPGDIYIECGDVNCDGSVDIVDALLIAQKYVGLDPAIWCL